MIHVFSTNFLIGIVQFIFSCIIGNNYVLLSEIWTILDRFDNLSHACGSHICQNKCKICYEKLGFGKYFSIFFLCRILMENQRYYGHWQLYLLLFCTSSFIDNYLLIFCCIPLVIEHWISNKLINKGMKAGYNCVIA